MNLPKYFPKINKIDRDISERTIGGQIFLILNDEKIIQTFKNFWLEGKIVSEIDYTIFFAVSKKPLKDSSGEFIIKKDSHGGIIFGSDGHPIIDHYLEEIEDAFIKFAKRQKFDFWRD